jgi:Flp pilus assembly protein TadD
MSRRRRREAAERREVPPVAVAEAPPTRPWLGPAVAALVAIAVYAPSLAGGFLYDDVAIVVENRRIRDLGALGTVLRYEPARPLLGLTWALNYAAAGATPWPYHAVNVALHAANAALVASLFGWIARRTPRVGPAAAVFAACFFAATPMAAETVAYVASRSSALCAAFALAALGVGVRALADDGRARGRYPAAIALFVLALAVKEEAACLPALLLLLDAAFVAPHAGPVRARARWHAPFWAIPALGLVARRAATGEWLPEAPVSRADYLLTQAAAYPGYLARAAVPFDPAFFRGAPVVEWPPAAMAALLAALGVALVAGAVVMFRRFPLPAFAVLWMAAALAPSSSLVPLREMVVDHRAYLGGAGVALALGAALWTPERRYFAALVLGLMAARAWHYQGVLGDPVKAWQDAVRRAPQSADAWRALADAYAGKGDRRAAESALRRAVEASPRDARGWANMGVAYAQAGRYADAERALREAVRADPGDARLHDNLGLVLEAQGRTDEAAAAYEGALAAAPPLAQPRIRLAAILLARGDRERARALLDDAASREIDAADAEAIEALRARLR